MERKRLEWLDIARGFGILAVVAVHASLLPNPYFLEAFLSAWMLPIFALSGGWVFRSYNNLGEFLWRKIRGLLFPYFVFIGVSLLSWLLQSGKIYYGGVGSRIAFEKLISYKILIGYPGVVNNALWFLPCYFLSLLLVRCLFPWWHKQLLVIKVVLILIIILVAFYFLRFIIQYPFSFDLAILFASFILLGNLASGIEKRLLLSAPATGLLTLLFVLGVLANGTVDVFEHIFHNPFLFYLNAVSGSLLVLQISHYIHTHQPFFFLRKWLSYIGRNSLFIFGLHVLILNWLANGLSATGLGVHIPGLWGEPNVVTFSDHIVSVLLRFLLFVLYLPLALVVGLSIPWTYGYLRKRGVFAYKLLSKRTNKKIICRSKSYNDHI